MGDGVNGALMAADRDILNLVAQATKQNIEQVESAELGMDIVPALDQRCVDSGYKLGKASAADSEALLLTNLTLVLKGDGSTPERKSFGSICIMTDDAVAIARQRLIPKVPTSVARSHDEPDHGHRASVAPRATAHRGRD